MLSFIYLLAGIAIAIILTIQWNRCPARKIEFPETVDAFLISYLVGGEVHLIRTTTFSLWNRNLIRIKEDPTGEDLIFREERDPPPELHPTEQLILDSIGDGTTLKRISWNKKLHKKIKEIYEYGGTELATRGLLFNQEMQNKRMFQGGILFGLFFVIGLALLLTENIQNILNGFLIFELFMISVIFIYYVSRTPHRLTPCGKKAISKARDQFEWILEKIKKQERPMAGGNPDYPLAMALFGAAEVFDTESKEFAPFLKSYISTDQYNEILKLRKRRQRQYYYSDVPEYIPGVDDAD